MASHSRSWLAKLGWLSAIAFGGFVVLVAALVAWLHGNWLFAIGTVVAGLFAYWWFDERSETQSAEETAERVAARSSGLFGGLLGGTGAFLVGMTAVALTFLHQTLAVIDVLINLSIGQPILMSTLAAIGSIFGLSAWLGLKASTVGILVVVLLISVALLRRRFMGKRVGDGDGDGMV